nr:hypothetical protein [Saccharopolyspora sp. HNM0983]
MQQEGIAAVLDRYLAMVEGVSGPGDADIDVLDYRITVHHTGANVLLALDAPALAAAEEAAASVLHELIGESDVLADWSVAHSEVRLTEDEFNQRLAAAENGDADTELEAAVEEALDTSVPEPAMDVEHWRTRLVELSEQLRAFSPDAFGPAPVRSAGRIAAGSLIHGIRVVTDELFYDELALAVNNATVADAVGLLVLEELPPCYAHRYDSHFARSFLLSSAAVAAQLTAPEWQGPRTVAESLALRLIVNEARVVLEAAELMDWATSEAVFAQFSEQAFAAVPSEELYAVDFALGGQDQLVPIAHADEVEDGLRERGLAFEQWFRPRGGPVGHHPYLS